MKLVRKNGTQRGDKLKMRTSKLILLVDFVVSILLTVIVVIGAFLDKDMTAVTTIAACWDAQMAAAVGFYYWKAKNENRSRHAMKLVKDLAKKYGIENVARLAETILKD